MKGMLVKDFQLLKGQKQFLVVAFCVSIFFLFSSENMVFGASYLMIMFAIFTMSTISYDEFDNGFAYLFTLPITREAYVREKYLFGLLSSGGIGLINTVLTVSVYLIKGGNASLPDILIGIASSFFAGMVMMAIMIPVQLKFGSEKRQIAMVAGFAVCFFFLYIGKKLVEKFGVPGFISGLKSISLTGIFGIVVGMLVLILAGSYLISIKVIREKEF